MRIAFEVIVAALAVFGLYFLCKVIGGWIFAPECIYATVIIERKDQIFDLELLLKEASSALFCTRGRRIAVLIRKELFYDLRACEIVAALDVARKYGARVITVKDHS